MNEELNVPLLRKMVEWVEGEATKPIREREWNQDSYVYRGVAFNCGTAYCVAGKIAIDAGWTPFYRRESSTSTERVEKDGVVMDADDVAKRVLGLEDVWGLFNAGNSSSDVRMIAEALAGEAL